jgi:hypothetical protein
MLRRGPGPLRGPHYEGHGAVSPCTTHTVLLEVRWKAAEVGEGGGTGHRTFPYVLTHRPPTLFYLVPLNLVKTLTSNFAPVPATKHSLWHAPTRRSTRGGGGREREEKTFNQKWKRPRPSRLWPTIPISPASGLSSSGEAVHQKQRVASLTLEQTISPGARSHVVCMQKRGCMQKWGEGEGERLQPYALFPREGEPAPCQICTVLQICTVPFYSKMLRQCKYQLRECMRHSNSALCGQLTS